MSLSRQLRSKIQGSYSLEELQTLCLDLGINFDELPGDRLSRKIDSLLVAAYRIPKLDQLHEFLTEDRPDESWPSLQAIKAFEWMDEGKELTFPDSISKQFTTGDVGEGAVVVQGDQAVVQTGDQVAGDKLIQNIYNTYQSAGPSNIAPLISKIKQQLNYVQILYFAGTGAISFLALSMILDPWVQIFGENSFGVVALLLFLFIAIGLIPGAAYGYFLTYIGEKIYKEKYNLQFLSLNAAVFGLSFLIISLSNDASSQRTLGWLNGFIVGVVFGVCMTIPWWMRSVNDRIYRVMITVVLCILVPFLVDLTLDFPIATIANAPASTLGTKMQNAIVVWMIFGGSLSFYFSIWPQDIANVLEITSVEE